MKFIIQDNLISKKNLDGILEGVRGLPHVRVNLTPFSRDISPDWVLEEKDWIPYGSTLFITLADELNWKGCYSDLAKFNYKASVENRNDMLNTGQIIPLREAIEFLKSQDPRSMWFVRPSEDRKQFSGQTVNAMEGWEWFEDAMNCASSGSYQLPGDTDIVISSPKEIMAEWRWFIVGGKIISGSMYRRRNQLYLLKELDEDVIKEAQSMADVWLPHPCCVMDTAVTKNGVHVIEFNSINGSGFYQHDIPAIMRSLYDWSNLSCH